MKSSADGSLRRPDYFAETFVAYVYFPKQLKQRDPKGYALIKKALTQAGIQ